MQENYWHSEENSTRDWIPGSDLIVQVNRLTFLLDTWQSVYLFQKADIHLAGQIPDISLKNTLFELRSLYLSGTPRSIDSNSRNWKLKHALNYLNKEIITLVTEESCAKQLITIMIQSKGFLVLSDVLSLYTGDDISSGKVYLILWKITL